MAYQNIVPPIAGDQPANHNIAERQLDLMHGAKEIAIFLYGSEAHVRKVYHLVETGRLPCFRLSKRVISARRSTLLKWAGGLEGEVRQ